MKKIVYSTLVALGCAMSVSAHADINVPVQKEWPVVEQGVREQLSLLNGNLSVLITSNSHSAVSGETNTIANNMSRAIQGIQLRQAKVIEESTPNLAKCKALTAQLASGNADGKANDYRNALQNSISQDFATTGAERSDSVKNRAALGVCTAQDVSNNIGGCAGKTPDPLYAGATENMNVLFSDFSNGNKTVTLPLNQLKMGQQYIKQLADFIPDTPSAGRNNSAYVKQLNSHRQGVATAQSAMQFILARHAPTGMSNGSSNSSAWLSSENANDYKAFFNTGIPSQPSLAERERFQAKQDMSCYKVSQFYTANEQVLLNEIRSLIAKQNYILQTQNEFKERELILQAKMLATLEQISHKLNDPSAVGAAGH